jgi:hypothetical protein
MAPPVMTRRRFPPPWTIEEANNACFIVKDANGFAVSYVYFENEPGRRQSHDKRRGTPDRCQHCPVARVAAR